MELRDTIRECDELLKKGLAAKVAAVLSGLSYVTIEREYRLPLATICRRASLFEEGLKILTPVIRGSGRIDEPSADETVEYAVLLLKSGSHDEALSLLSGLDPGKTQLVHMYRGFVHMARWDYPSAKAELERQLGREMEEYSENVCRVNLAACLVALEMNDEAMETLGFLIERFESRNLLRLLSNCLELRSQIHIFRKDWALARADLQKSYEILRDENTTDQLLVKKWLAVLEAHERGDAGILEKLRPEILKRRHAESVRDIDWNILKIRFEQGLFDYVLFGTPFHFFRERMRKTFPTAEIKREIVLGAPAIGSLHLATGELTGFSAESLAGRSLNLVSILMRDFYRPKSVGELFVNLYPGEKFDVFTSINRVHQAVRYVRKQIKDLGLPIIIEEDGGYRLQTAADFALVVPLERGRLPDPVLERLKRQFYGAEFTAAEAMRYLKISQSKFQRWCSQACSSGLLESIFKGAATRYRITEEEPGRASEGN